MNLDLGDTRLIIAKAKTRGVLRNQLAYMLATAKWETAHTMRPVREAYWLSEDWRRKNLRYWPWYGRGYVQLTWEDNYKRAGNELGLDLTTDPDVVMEPGIAAEILVAGAMAGWFTGAAIPDYITLQKSDFVNARRVINRMDKAQEIAALARDYDAALKAEGYGEAPVEPPRADWTPTPAEQPQGIWAALVSAILGIFGGKK
jgi:hypothetical protein